MTDDTQAAGDSRNADGTQATDDTQQQLVTLFTKALRKLGDAGQADEASRLGGKAWWVLQKDGDDRNAERVNGTMHYLADILTGVRKPKK